ncbi:MAG: HIT domain-containing protein [Deltaproteobacteria bacterium]|nr:HIT domain-containing protein [Deltaproteobacteria bacterium]
MQVLWAPWRGAYFEAPKATGCIFCAARDASEPRQQLVLTQTPAVVILNKFPYASAHLMVAPLRHTADLAGMPPEELHVLISEVQRAAGVLYDVLRPEGLNIGINLGAAAGAGITDHLHWHLVPRWVGDTNFMPMLAEVRVMPEHLEATWEKLRRPFQIRE